MRENRQQLLRLEEELFDTALLGLLELEGRRLMEENRQLSSDPGNDKKCPGCGSWKNGQDSGRSFGAAGKQPKRYSNR